MMLENHTGITGFQSSPGFESRKKWPPQDGTGGSAFSKQLRQNANHQPASTEADIAGRYGFGHPAGQKRTRPLAQYTANGLASPGH
jgi:hypothetical protein